MPKLTYNNLNEDDEKRIKACLVSGANEAFKKSGIAATLENGTLTIDTGEQELKNGNFTLKSVHGFQRTHVQNMFDKLKETVQQDGTSTFSISTKNAQKQEKTREKQQAKASPDLQQKARETMKPGVSRSTTPRSPAGPRKPGGRNTEGRNTEGRNTGGRG